MDEERGTSMVWDTNIAVAGLVLGALLLLFLIHRGFRGVNVSINE